MSRIPLIIALFISLGLGLPAFSQMDDGDAIDYTYAKEYEIEGITVTGAENFDENAIITLSGLYKGQTINIPGDEIPKAIQNLWDRNLFANVEIYASILANKIFFEIKLEERPRLSRFKFEGLKKSEIEDIKKKLSLRSGNIINENTKINAENVIKDYFIDKGFLNVQVDIQEIQDSILANSVMLIFDVVRGDKVKVLSIKFEGNETVTSVKLKKLMGNTKEKVKFQLAELIKVKKNRSDSAVAGYQVPGNVTTFKAYRYLNEYINLNIFKGSKFLKDDYEADKQSIIAYYNNLGYRDAAIVMDTFYLIDEKAMNIEMSIDEGIVYYHRNITWSGNTKFQDSVLAKVLAIKKGDVYNQSLLQEKIYGGMTGIDISSLYMDQGYLFFNVTPVEQLVGEDSVDLELRIYEGPIARIDQVRIYGNTKTSEHVIRRELRTQPGDVFSREGIIRSQREIANLGYFDPEQMDVVPIPNPEKGTVDIEYTVVEKPSDQLELSAGWAGRGNGVVGTLGVQFTNFSLKNMFKKEAWRPLPSGDGQRLSVRIQTNGRLFQSYNVSFTEPWLGGRKPNSFTVAYARTRLNNVGIDNRIIGSFISNGLSFNIGTRLQKPDDFFIVQGGISLDRYNLNNYDNNTFIFSDGISNNLSFNISLSRNSISGPSAPLYPSRGSNVGLSLKFTLPYSKWFSGRKNIDYTDPDLPDDIKYKWIEYHKWRFDVQWFAPLTRNDKLVLMAQAKLGFLGLYNNELGYSPFERYEIGGDGLANNQFFIGRDIISQRGYQVYSPSTGAPIFNKYTLEIRYPISLNPSATVYALMFAEAGNYWNSPGEYNPFQLRRAFGAGVRVFLPMFGLLGFDYGIGFDGKPGRTGNIFSKYGEFRIILGFEPE